jgi:hypothetical protein
LEGLVGGGAAPIQVLGRGSFIMVKSGCGGGMEQLLWFILSYGEEN